MIQKVIDHIIWSFPIQMISQLLCWLGHKDKHMITLPYVTVVHDHPDRHSVYTWLMHNMIVYPLASWQVQWQGYTGAMIMQIHTDHSEAHEFINAYWRDHT